MKIGPCIVCYEECGHFPGEYTLCCIQPICEECENNMQGLCPICDRKEMNMDDCECDNCGSIHTRLEDRHCPACDESCCKNCTIPLECCFNGEKCICLNKCVICYECQDDFDENADDYVDIHDYIEKKEESRHETYTNEQIDELVNETKIKIKDKVLNEYTMKCVVRGTIHNLRASDHITDEQYKEHLIKNGCDPCKCIHELEKLECNDCKRRFLHMESFKSVNKKDCE